MNEAQGVIAALEKARRDALVAVDKDALGRLLSDDLIWTHASGVIEDKAAYVSALGTKARFTRIDVVDERIAVYGGAAAAVVAELSMSIKPVDREEMTLRTRASSVWAKEGDNWRLVRFHSGMVT